MNVTIYADGSVKGNNAGWGFVLYSENVKLLGCGRLRDSNINRVELIAVLQGLQRTAPGDKVEVYTDSHYVLSGAKHWRKYQGELWVRFRTLCENRHVILKHVTAHPDHHQAHHLARKGSLNVSCS